MNTFFDIFQIDPRLNYENSMKVKNLVPIINNHEN